MTPLVSIAANVNVNCSWPSKISSDSIVAKYWAWLFWIVKEPAKLPDISSDVIPPVISQSTILPFGILEDSNVNNILRPSLTGDWSTVKLVYSCKRVVLVVVAIVVVVASRVWPITIAVVLVTHPALSVTWHVYVPDGKPYVPLVSLEFPNITELFGLTTGFWKFAPE